MRVRYGGRKPAVSRPKAGQDMGRDSRERDAVRLPRLAQQLSMERVDHWTTTWQEHGASTARWRAALRRHRLPSGDVTPASPRHVIKTPFTPLASFRKAVRLTILLLTAVRRSVMSLADVHLMTLGHYPGHLADGGYDYGPGLVFNPTAFRRKKEAALCSEARLILSMDRRQRSQPQLRQALVAMTTVVAAFAEFPRSMRHALIRVGRYESYEPKRVIIRQGHYADNFYLIISGTTVVTLETMNKKTNQPTSETLAILGRGNSFGDLAIMHGAKRSATVTCQNRVELLAVERDDYVDIFMHLDGDRAPPHIAFLHKADVLCGWPLAALPWNDTRVCVLTYFRRGCVMCRDAIHSDWIYIVKTGRCRVLKRVVVVTSNLRQLRRKQLRHRRELRGCRNGRLPPAGRPTPRADSIVTGGMCDGDGSPVQRTSTRWLPPLPDRTQPAGSPESSTNAQPKTDRHALALQKNSLISANIKPVCTPSRYVEILSLGPNSTFGLEPIAFRDDECTGGLVLVSEGAEVVLIKKTFFTDRLTEDVMFTLRTTVRPYPKGDGLRQRLQDETNWEAFKAALAASFRHDAR